MKARREVNVLMAIASVLLLVLLLLIFAALSTTLT